MANNLKAIREKRGLSMPQLAERMGTTKNMLVKLESGARTLDMKWIELAATALGVRLEAIIREPSPVPDDVVDALYDLDPPYLERAIDSILTVRRMQEHGVPLPVIQKIQQPGRIDHDKITDYEAPQVEKH